MPGEPVLGRVEAGLQQAQRERRQLEHLAAPARPSPPRARSSGTTVFTSPMSSACCASYWRHRNQISLAFFGPTWSASRPGAEAAVEAADARAGLAEAGVVGGDREVADDVQHVAAADRVAGDHRDDRLGQAPHLDVQVGDVEAARRAARPRPRSRCRRARAGRRPSRRRAAPRRSGRSRRRRVSSRARSSASEISISVSGGTRCAPRAGRS